MMPPARVQGVKERRREEGGRGRERGRGWKSVSGKRGGKIAGEGTRKKGRMESTGKGIKLIQH